MELIKSLPTHELARRERARLVHGWLGVDRGNPVYLQDECANDHWVSAYAGARINSDPPGYGLMRLRWHRDAANWLSFQLDHSAIYSAVYQNVGLAGFVTLRMP